MSVEEPVVEKIIDRIIKMQERTTDRGFTEAEAMESMAKIGQLLVDYNLSISDINARREQETDKDAFEVVKNYIRNELQVDKATASKDSWGWYITLADAISSLCFCKMLFSPKGTGVWFIGVKEDANVAGELYSWMRDQAWILACHAHDQLEGSARYVHTRTWLDSWLTGFTQKIWSRVLLEVYERNKNENVNAIVVSKTPLIDDFMLIAFPNVTMATMENKDTYTDAFIDGQRVAATVPLYEMKKVGYTMALEGNNITRSEIIFDSLEGFTLSHVNEILNKFAKYADPRWLFVGTEVYEALSNLNAAVEIKYLLHTVKVVKHPNLEPMTMIVTSINPEQE